MPRSLVTRWATAKAMHYHYQRKADRDCPVRDDLGEMHITYIANRR